MVYNILVWLSVLRPLNIRVLCFCVLRVSSQNNMSNAAIKMLNCFIILVFPFFFVVFFFATLSFPHVVRFCPVSASVCEVCAVVIGHSLVDVKSRIVRIACRVPRRQTCHRLFRLHPDYGDGGFLIRFLHFRFILVGFMMFSFYAACPTPQDSSLLFKDNSLRFVVIRFIVCNR